MKKLFLMGFVALAFASCVSDKDVTPQTQGEKYEKAFENLIGGTINANVNWGFVNQPVAVFDAEGHMTGMRGAQPNANEYGKVLEVPTEMTAEQKAKVMKFFNETELHQGVSVNWSDFFVHQVGQTERGKYMNFLYCGEKNYEQKIHVNNFNGGSSTDKKNVGVELLPDGNNCKQVDYTDGIMLVQDASTELFAFHNSYDDTYYENNFIMIDGATIDAAIPEGPSVAGMFFVGFDYQHDKTKMNENDIVERDYYFNDWVIRVSPGIYTNSKRIMVEDLIANDLSQVDLSDWDFNDAVFDVAFLTSTDWSTGTGVTKIEDTIITLWSAGGTKALTIGGKEVHELFGQPTNKMINTNATNGVDGLVPVIFRVSSPAEPNATLIPVYVGSTELKAETGKAPQKIEVDRTTRWMKERQIITKGYANFATYAIDNTPADWYKTVTNASVLY